MTVWGCPAGTTRSTRIPADAGNRLKVGVRPEKVAIARGSDIPAGKNGIVGTVTMTTYIGATSRGDIPTGSTVYKTVFAVGITLFVMTLVMNLISIRFVRKYRQVYE